MRLVPRFSYRWAKTSSTVRTTSITDKTGCFTTSQRKRENNARIKNTTSVIVILFSPYFKHRKKINIQTAETANVIHTPLLQAPITCNAQVIELEIPQIKKVKVCGVVFLFKISRMYGPYPTKTRMTDIKLIIIL